jgi:hypothetical protein
MWVFGGEVAAWRENECLAERWPFRREVLPGEKLDVLRKGRSLTESLILGGKVGVWREGGCLRERRRFADKWWPGGKRILGGKVGVWMKGGRLPKGRGLVVAHIQLALKTELKQVVVHNHMKGKGK